MMNQRLPSNPDLDRASAAASRDRLGKLLKHPYRIAVAKSLERLSFLGFGPLHRRARTFWGDEMIVAIPEQVSTAIWKFGLFEEELTRIVLGLVRPGMVFVDVGAHFGYFSLLASHIVGKRGSVHALEPSPTTFGLLAQNLQQRENCTLYNLAAWSTDELLTFRDYGVEFSAFNSAFEARLPGSTRKRLRERSFFVQARALDSLFDDIGVAPDFIKIDAESAELSILEGMIDTVKKHAPVITVEVGDFGVEEAFPSRQILEFAQSLGYDPFELRDNQLQNHRLRDRYRYANILLIPKRRPG